jgi:hypothetical protein
LEEALLWGKAIEFGSDWHQSAMVLDNEVPSSSRDLVFGETKNIIRGWVGRGDDTHLNGVAPATERS